MNMVIILGIAVLLITSVLILALIITNYKIHKKEIERDVELGAMDLLMYAYQIKISDDDFIFLDNIVKESVDNYYITKYPDRINVVDDYISKDMQDDIIRESLRIVLGRISPVMRDKLSLIYNDEALDDIIYEKVSMHVLSLTINNNK